MSARDERQTEGRAFVLRRIRRLPSPALVIASLALILAIGGGAAFALTHNERKAVKKIARNIANKKITQRAPTLSVDHAQTANHANNADTATAAGNGALGYARVSSAGVVTQGSNITSANITHTGTGVYCFHGLSFNPNNIQADPDAAVAFADVYVEVPGGGSCANNQAGVFTFNQGATTSKDAGFYVIFH
jgi:hypothetical protein